MSDIVERLRTGHMNEAWSVMLKAADEIERLRAEIKRGIDRHRELREQFDEADKVAARALRDNERLRTALKQIADGTCDRNCGD